MSEEQLKAFLEKVKADTSLREKLKAAASLKPFLKSLKKQDFRLLLKTFNQWDRWRQTQSWKVQLAAKCSPGSVVGSPAGRIVNRLL